MAVVVGESLRKSYGDTTALRGVSLTVDEGEVYALVGPNGAGKTTLIRCLTGTTRPDAGTAQLFDQPLDRVNLNRLGLLPQEFQPAPRLTARELVTYYADLYEESREPRTVLDEVGLATTGDTQFRELSGGQKRRALVGIALVNDPDVLFLDEPTTGIDPAGRRAVWELIESLTTTGTTVVLTTHNLDEVDRLADRVGVLADGRLVATGTPSGLVAEHGGANRLEIMTTEPVALDAYATHHTDHGVVIEDVAPGDIGAIISELEAAGVSFQAVTWRAPALESAYLELTGEIPARSLVGTEGPE